MIKQKLLPLLLLCICVSCSSQSKKIPIAIQLDTINTTADLTKYKLPSFTFEYDDDARLIKMIDSIKKRDTYRVRELLFTYDKNGRLQQYTYTINGELDDGHTVTYDNNTVTMASMNKIGGYTHTFELDRSNKIIKGKSIHTNAYFNSSIAPNYYDDGSIKKGGDFSYIYSDDKGVFANVHMEPWCRVFFEKLITLSLQKRNVTTRTTYKSSDNSVYATKNYEYEIENNYPTKLLNGKVVYKVIYKND